MVTISLGIQSRVGALLAIDHRWVYNQEHAEENFFCRHAVLYDGVW
jgi:hypothetical protein